MEPSQLVLPTTGPSSSHVVAKSSKMAMVKQQVREFMLTSSFQGIPNILRSKYSLIRAMWLLFLVVSAAVCSLFVSMSVKEYAKYDVVTKIRYRFILMFRGVPKNIRAICRMGTLFFLAHMLSRA